jgi:molybdate transport system permease protein
VRDAHRRELRAVLHDSGIPSVVVTHHPEEAAMLADEIVVLEDGALQTGLRADVFSRSAGPSVAALLGIENICVGTMLFGDRIDAGGARIEVDRSGVEPGSAIYWCVRPEKVTVDVAHRPTGDGYHHGTVDDVIDLGREVEGAVTVGDGVRLWSRSAGPRDQSGDFVPSADPPDDVVMWSASATNREPALR